MGGRAVEAAVSSAANSEVKRSEGGARAID
jgi:hypothetical protein